MRLDRLTYRCETEDGVMHNARWRDQKWTLDCEGPYTFSAQWRADYPVLTCVACAARAQ